MSTPEKDVETLGHSYIAEENIKWYSHSGKQLRSFFKNKETDKN